ncbi:MAG: Zn-dependent hydrolase [Thermoleophilia bacterium]
MTPVDAPVVPRHLRELAELTGDDDGAQRVAWTERWVTARDWLRGQLAGIPGVEVHTDPAGNIWATLPGESDRSVVVGGHLDSVPNGGWLDGALNVTAALEVLRAVAGGPRPALTLRLVDWADEEGARFGRSLVGSSACAGTLDTDALRGLTDRDGVALPDALAAQGVDLDRMLEAGAELRDVAAYLELHIEQGPVLERIDRPLGVVTGIFGLQRHVVRFRGAHAHAGSTPMDMRRDAFLAAARSAVAFRETALRRPETRATVGSVTVAPGIVTAFNGLCELTLDQRAVDAAVVAEMVAEAREASLRIAAEEGCEVEWIPQFAQEPVAFDARLVESAAEVLEDLTGAPAPRLPSGPLHDAAEMARRVPAVMLFVRSIGGVSHTKDEDTAVEDLELSARALHDLTLRTIEAPWTSA